MSAAASAGDAEKTKTVVVLYADANDGRPGHVLVDRGIRSTFAAGDFKAVEVHSEHLDVSRFADPDYQQDLAEFLRRKYADRKADVVIAALASGLDFALKYREHAFPGVPIVYCAVDHREASARRLPPDVIGVPISFDLTGTLDVALQLHPHTRRVYVVTGKSKFDVQWQAEARRSFQPYEDRLEIVDLAGLPMPELLRRVAELPENSIVYYVHVFQDGDGSIFIPAEALTSIAKHASVPVYGHVDTYVGRGIVGGHVFSFEASGRDAATLSLQVLAGKKPESIGVQPIAENRYMFDARELERWGISTAKLPPGSEVRHREPLFWDLYRWHILGVLSLCVIEALLIIGLLVQRLSRQRAEKTLRQSQAELRELPGKLLQAQETERRRLARELHDDLSQSLAFLAVELDILGQQLLAKQQPVDDTAGRLGNLSATVKQLGSAVHDLSHQLHPAKLEQLGLVAAIRGLCNDLKRNHGVAVEFTHQQVSSALDKDVALCLYRIAQESLQNVVKHSAAASAQVELTWTGEAIGLRVSDNGKGFDPEAANRREGLGLVGMRERLRLVGGEIAINSQPAAGTSVEVRVRMGADAKPAAETSALPG